MARSLEESRQILKESIIDYKESLEKFRSKKRMVIHILNLLPSLLFHNILGTAVYQLYHCRPTNIISVCCK